MFILLSEAGLMENNRMLPVIEDRFKARIRVVTRACPSTGVYASESHEAPRKEASKDGLV